MQKLILYSKEARDEIFNGMKKVADAVCVTLGPKGRNVIISRSQPSQNGMQYWQPVVTKDGVTVSRNITLTDYKENVGCLMIREAAEKTMQNAGDGTTSTILLTKTIVEKSLPYIEDGISPMALKKEIDEVVVLVCSQLKELAIPIKGNIEKIQQVATVSANNDEIIGGLISEAFRKIGDTGMIDIQEAKGPITEIKTTDGYKVERGWLSPYFINNYGKSSAELIDPYILLYDKKISTQKQLEKTIQLVMNDGKPLLIICEDMDGEALAMLAMNAHNKSFPCCVVRAPEFGEAQRDAMEDLAIITGGTYVSTEKGMGLNTINRNQFGKAKKILVSKEETIIISGATDKDKLDSLLDELKMDVTKAEGEQKEKIEKRIARLTGGIAIMYVGAATETEMKELKDRCDDAVRATKAAIAEGIIVGGGTAFLRLAFRNRQETPAYKIISEVLQAPLKMICQNAGVDAEKTIYEVMANSDFNVGYNAREERIENLIDAGIIDPVLVLTSALKNAASSATMVLTSETLICDVL